MTRTTPMTARALLALIAMAIVVPQLTACNTMQGAGKDIENAGEKIQDKAEENK